MPLATIKDNLAKNLAAITGIASAALTGTVSKSAGSATLTGAGTAFQTELKPGCVISVPGTAVEYFVVSAIASDTALTLSQSAVYTASGQTVTRYSVSADTPEKAPEKAECPSVQIALREPSLDASPVANGLTHYNWHFQIRLLLYPVGVETRAQKEQDIEPFPARFVARFAANNSLQGACVSVDFRHSFSIGFFNFQGVDFYGLTWDINVFDQAAETYSA
jgi:hypothetical protein